MTNMLFFKGHGGTAIGAIERAIANCAPILVNNPALLVQLEDISPMGHEWDAHIRVVSLDVESGGVAHKEHHESGEPAQNYNIDDVETAKREGNDSLKTLRHDHPEAAYRFGNSASGGQMPDVPIQDIQFPDYEVAKASEPELKRILFLLEEKRKKVFENQKLELDN